MKSSVKKYFVWSVLVVFLGTTMSAMSSCSAKKKCHPPCPTWNKKKKH